MLTKSIKCPTCGAEPGEPCVKIGTDIPVPHLHTARFIPNDLISINQAVDLGIDRLRKPMWANKCDHLKIDILDGELGPWIHIYSPSNELVNGRDPVSILRGSSSFVPIAGQDACEFELYEGPLPGSEEYKSLFLQG